MSNVKVGDVVCPNDGSYSTIIVNNQLREESGCNINNEDWKVVCINMDLPRDGIGNERRGWVNDVVIQSVYDKRIVFISSKFLNVKPTCKHCGGAL